MKLGKYFTLEEMTASSSHLDNTPSTEQIINLKQLVEHVLDPLRNLYGHPIKINSGFRTLAVNKEKGGKSRPLSQHCKGEAADLKSDNNALLFRLIRDTYLFDQLIWEGGDDNQPAWVHVSYKTQGNRGEILKMKIVNGKKEYSHIK